MADLRSRLCEATLADLPPDVERPGYDRAVLAAGVVHLGIGAFHRAHQAVVFDDVARRGDLRWGVRAVSLRSPDVRDRLAPQDGLYTLAVRDGSREAARVIGVVRREVLLAPKDPAAVVEALAAVDTRLVTLTVTEKGYRLDPASGALLKDDPDVAADLLDLSAPGTVPGLIAAALALRRSRGLAPFSVLSCDNLSHNGRRLEAAVLAMAAARDLRLRDWIEAEGAFPETMVDRIVPATTAQDVELLAGRLGVLDTAPVKTEPFFQWVVEDRFAGERPDLEAVGVQLASSVAPWEAAKLRLLNGAHSAMAYLGGLQGLGYVHEVATTPEGRALVERLWAELVPTLTPPPGLDLQDYRGRLMARFTNPALQHRTRQIATDGSQKIPPRLLAPLLERSNRGQPFDALALAVAGWMRWQGGRDDQGTPFPVDDPLAAATARAWASDASARGRVAALLALETIFPPELAARADIRHTLARWLDILDRQGAKVALKALANSPPEN